MFVGLLVVLGCTSLLYWTILFFLPTISYEEKRGSRHNNSPSLAEKLIQGFVRVYNHADQGICIALPQSANQGVRFFIPLLNTPLDLTHGHILEILDTEITSQKNSFSKQNNVKIGKRKQL